MRVLYVIGSTERGGAEQHLLQVTGGLRARGLEPVVFAIRPNGPLTPAFQQRGVPVIGAELPPWVTRVISHPRALAWLGLFLAAASLWWHLWRLRPTAVHFFLPMAYLVGGLVSLFGPPTRRIMSRRSLNHYQAQHRLFARLELCLHPRMDVICGNSRAVMDDLRREGVKEHQLKLIYSGVDLTRFQHVRPRDVVREELGSAQEDLVFVIVANLIPYKGHSDLLKAFALIDERLARPWVCWCVGRDDGIGAALQAEADRFGLGGKIRFLGSRSDVPDLLRAADIGVLCSHEEGFSNAVLEGMAAALPMVVTDAGGNAEAVLDGHSGYVVPRRSPEALSEALWRVASDPARVEMGQRAFERARDVFSFDACLENYLVLYQCPKN